ncbi:MAG: hypothetical protein V3573_04405 [Desulfovibrionaceae bacterium]
MLQTLRQLKDRGLSAALRLALNEKFSRYGKITALRLDTGEHQLHVDVLLEGETDLTVLCVEKYGLQRDEDALLLELGHVTVSRPWLERVLNDAADRMLTDRKLRIEHPAVAKVLSAVL